MSQADTLSAPAWQDRYAAWLFLGVFVVAAALGFIGPLGFAALAGLGGLLALPLVRPSREAFLAVAMLGVLVVWSWISLGWARYEPDFSVRSYKMLEHLTGIKLIIEAVLYSALVAATGRLLPSDAERALRIFAVALTGLAAVLVIEGLSRAHIYMAFQAHLLRHVLRPDLALRAVAQGGYVIAVMVWPVSLLLRREGRNMLVIALLAGLIATTVMFKVDAPAAGLATGLLAMVAVLIFGRVGVLALGGLSAIYVMATPWIMAPMISAGLFERFKVGLPPSWDARLTIWAFTDARILEQPLLGWGMDASRSWPHIIPLHPHNASLQLWLELGGVGAVIAAAFVFFLFWLIAKATEGKAYMAVASATLAAYLAIGALSFGVWQEWWLGIGAVAFCACLALKRAMPLWGDPAAHPFDRPLRPL
jgi:O-antigen ligase